MTRLLPPEEQLSRSAPESSGQMLISGNRHAIPPVPYPDCDQAGHRAGTDRYSCFEDQTGSWGIRWLLSVVGAPGLWDLIFWHPGWDPLHCACPCLSPSPCGLTYRLLLAQLGAVPHLKPLTKEPELGIIHLQTLTSYILYLSSVKVETAALDLWGSGSQTVFNKHQVVTIISLPECQRIDAFELWCWRRLLKVPWTARRSNQSILREINPEYSLEGLKLQLQYSGHLMRIDDSLEKSLMLGFGEDWGQKEKGASEDEMAGWCNERELGQSPGDGEGEGGLACCSPWGCDESHTAGLLNSNNKVIIIQFSSVAQSCPTLCDPMNHSTPGLPVHHQLPEFTQTHVSQVGDAIQPSHPLSSPPPPAPNPSQHQGQFQQVNSLQEVAKVLEFQL